MIFFYYNLQFSDDFKKIAGDYLVRVETTLKYNFANL